MMVEEACGEIGSEAALITGPGPNVMSHNTIFQRLKVKLSTLLFVHNQMSALGSCNTFFCLTLMYMIHSTSKLLYLIEQSKSYCVKRSNAKNKSTSNFQQLTEMYEISHYKCTAVRHWGGAINSPSTQQLFNV